LLTVADFRRMRKGIGEDRSKDGHYA